MVNPFAAGANKTLKLWLGVIGLVIVAGLGALIFTGNTNLYKGALTASGDQTCSDYNGQTELCNATNVCTMLTDHCVNTLTLKTVCDKDGCFDFTDATARSISGQAEFLLDLPVPATCANDEEYRGVNFLADFYIDTIIKIPSQSAGGACWNGLLKYKVKLNTVASDGTPLVANGNHSLFIRYTDPVNASNHQITQKVYIDVQNAEITPVVTAPTLPAQSTSIQGPASGRGALFTPPDACKSLEKYACEDKAPTCKWVPEKAGFITGLLAAPAGPNRSSTIPAHCEASTVQDTAVSSVPGTVVAPAAPTHTAVSSPAPSSTPSSSTVTSPAALQPISATTANTTVRLTVNQDNTFNEFNTPQLPPQTDNQQVASFIFHNTQNNPATNYNSIGISELTLEAPLLAGQSAAIPVGETNFSLQLNGRDIADFLPIPTTTSTTVTWTAAPGKTLFDVPPEDGVTIGVFATTGTTAGSFGFMIKETGIKILQPNVTIVTSGTFPVAGGNYSIAGAIGEASPSQGETSSPSTPAQTAALPSAPTVAASTGPRFVRAPATDTKVKEDSLSILETAQSEYELAVKTLNQATTQLAKVTTKAGELNVQKIQEVVDALEAAGKALAEAQANQAESATQLKELQILNETITNATPGKNNAPTKSTLQAFEELQAEAEKMHALNTKTYDAAKIALKKINDASTIVVNAPSTKDATPTAGTSPAVGLRIAANDVKPTQSLTDTREAAQKLYLTARQENTDAFNNLQVAVTKFDDAQKLANEVGAKDFKAALDAARLALANAQRKHQESAEQLNGIKVLNSKIQDEKLADALKTYETLQAKAAEMHEITQNTNKATKVAMGKIDEVLTQIAAAQATLAAATTSGGTSSTVKPTPSLADFKKNSEKIVIAAQEENATAQEDLEKTVAQFDDAAKQTDEVEVQEVKEALESARAALDEAYAHQTESAAQLAVLQKLNSTIQGAEKYTKELSKEFERLQTEAAAMSAINSQVADAVKVALEKINDVFTQIAAAKTALLVAKNKAAEEKTVTVAAKTQPDAPTPPVVDQNAAQIAALSSQLAALNQQMNTLRQQNQSSEQQLQLQQQIAALQAALLAKSSTSSGTTSGASTITFLAPTAPATTSTTSPLVAYNPPATKSVSSPAAAARNTSPTVSSAPTATSAKEPLMVTTSARNQAPARYTPVDSRLAYEAPGAAEALEASTATEAAQLYTITAVSSNEDAATSRRETRAMHGAAIRGSSGPEVLLYPLLIASVNGLYYAVRRRRNKGV